MTNEQAQKKRCPFMKRTKHNNDMDIACKGNGCMAWGYQNRNAAGNNIPDSGYCKRLA